MILRELRDFGCIVDVSDYWADKDEVKREYNLDLVDNGELIMENYDGVVLAVAHEKLKNLNSKLLNLKSNNRVFYDIKGVLSKKDGGLQ